VYRSIVREATLRPQKNKNLKYASLRKKLAFIFSYDITISKNCDLPL